MFGLYGTVKVEKIIESLQKSLEEQKDKVNECLKDLKNTPKIDVSSEDTENIFLSDCEGKGQSLFSPMVAVNAVKIGDTIKFYNPI